MANNDYANRRSFRKFPNVTQALFEAVAKCVLTVKSIFARIGKKLRIPAVRRCGGMVDATDLKSVLAEAGYGFESHHRHPQEIPILVGRSGSRLDFVDCESSRKKTQRNTAYPSSIRQVILHFRRAG